jgi:hypothetical protein
MQEQLDFAFESARFPLDSRKSNGAGSFLSHAPGHGHDGSTIPQRHDQLQGTALRYVRRLVFPAPKQTQPMASRILRHTPGRPAIMKARSPSQIASRVSSCGSEFASFGAKKSHWDGPGPLDREFESPQSHYGFDGYNFVATFEEKT